MLGKVKYVFRMNKTDWFTTAIYWYRNRINRPKRQDNMVENVPVVWYNTLPQQDMNSTAASITEAAEFVDMKHYTCYEISKLSHLNLFLWDNHSMNIANSRVNSNERTNWCWAIAIQQYFSTTLIASALAWFTRMCEKYTIIPMLRRCL